jgi:hypothetical protein
LNVDQQLKAEIDLTKQCRWAPRCRPKAMGTNAWSSGSVSVGTVRNRVADPCPQGTTAVVALAELLAGFGSLVLEDAEAVFVIVAFLDGGWTTIVTVTVDLLGIVPRAQVTILFAGWVKLQLPCVVVAVPKDVFLGSSSVIVTPAALNGPPLCTVSL